MAAHNKKKEYCSNECRHQKYYPSIEAHPTQQQNNRTWIEAIAMIQ